MAKSVDSVNGTSKNLTVAEMREKYQEFDKKIQFDRANAALKQLRDIKKTYTTNIPTFNKEILRNYLKNIGSNQKNLRNLSWFLYYRSQVYFRLIHFYADMFSLDCRKVVPNVDLKSKISMKNMLNDYYETLDFLDNLRLQQEFNAIYLTCFVQDVFYGVAFCDETGFFVFNFPADYAKIMGKYDTGDFYYAIDTSYIRKYPELMEYYPHPFKDLYEKAQKENQKWQVMPSEYAMCFKFRAEDINTILPVFTPMFNSLINLADLEDVQAVADQQSIYKLLWMELETIDGSKSIDDWKVDPSLVAKYYDRMLDELPEYISAAIVPGKLSEISFNNDQTDDTNKIAKATETVLNTAGGAEILNGSTINNTYAFKLACIQNTEYAISSLLPQTESWVNRFLRSHLNNASNVSFFPISVYTKNDFKDTLLQGGQNGFPTKLAYNTLNGFSEKETIILNMLEEDALHLSEKLIPLSTSYTKSDSDTDPITGGRPQEDLGDLTDDGARNRGKSGN